MNFREYIVDLMAAPGTLIPSDVAGSHIDYDESFFSASPLLRDIDSSHVASSSSGVGSSFEEHSDSGTFDKRSRLNNPVSAVRDSDDRNELTAQENLANPSEDAEESKMPSDDFRKPSSVEKVPVREFPGRPTYAHARSPSWTEGVSSPAVRRMKVKDVSQYMIDAAKENPQLAQKLHDVLLESGVVAPPNLFTEVYAEQLDALTVEEKSQEEDKDQYTEGIGNQENKGQDDIGPVRFLPPLPQHRVHSKVSVLNQQEHPKPVEGLGVNDSREITGLLIASQSEVAPVRYGKNVPVAAAAAAAAAVVASSMVVAAAKSSSDSNIEIPVAAAATATAAAVVATTAAVSKQYEQGTRSDGDTEGASCEPQGSGDCEHDALGANMEGERISDRSAGSTKSDVTIDDVAECEIPWEDITLGERIGLGTNPCIMLLNDIFHVLSKSYHKI